MDRRGIGPVPETGGSVRRGGSGWRTRLSKQAVEEEGEAQDDEKAADPERRRGRSAGEGDQHHQAEPDAHQRDAGAAVPPGARGRCSDRSDPWPGRNRAGSTSGGGTRPFSIIAIRSRISSSRTRAARIAGDDAGGKFRR